MPPADTWPPQLLSSCSLALGCVTELCWTSPQRLSGDWFLLHCGILSRYFSILPSLLCWEDWGRRFSFCQPWQTRSLVAQSLIAPFGGWSAALCWSLYPRNQLSSFLQRLVPFKTFFLPPIPASSCQFLPGACLEAGTESFTWEQLSQMPKPAVGHGKTDT